MRTLPWLLASFSLLSLPLACGDDTSAEDPPASSGGAAGKGGKAGQGGKAGSAGQAGAGGLAAGASGSGAGSGGAGSGAGGASGVAGGAGAGVAGAGTGGAGQGGAGAGGAGSGGAGQSGSSGQSGGAGQPGGGQGGSGGAGPLSCSDDLSSVVGSNGAVVEVCADDKGCKEGACVPLCEAADAAGSNLGCEFWVATPRTIGTDKPPTLQPCFAVMLANTTKKAAKLGVEQGPALFDVTKFGRIPKSGVEPKDWPALGAEGLPPGEVAVLFLSHDPDAIQEQTKDKLSCPVPTATGASGVEGSGVGKGFRITSDAPVSAYDIFPFGGARSYFPGAQVLFPGAAAGTNYVFLGPPRGTTSIPGPAFAQVLATEDNTSVTLAPTESLPAAGAIAAIAKGAKQTFVLQRGEYAQWEVEGSFDLAGSVLESDKRVVASVGTRFLRLQTQEAPGGETTHNAQQPVSALGHSYAAAPYETRRKDLAPEEIRYRVVGSVDGTALSYDPPVPGAPAALGKGQVVDFTTSLAFEVKSQGATHPFSMAQMMSSANLEGGSREGALSPVTFDPSLKPPFPLGDEEFVPLLPPEQFRSNYVFFTDPTYSTTNVTVIRVKGPSGFDDVEVECLGKLGSWKPLGAGGQIEYTTADLLRANKPSGTCQNGRQVASSAGRFGLIVWGLDSYASYGYPAGGNARKTTEVVIKP